MRNRISFVSVIADNPTIVKFLSNVLKANDLEPVQHASGEEFLYFLGGGRHSDCVIISQKMSGMSGLDVLTGLLLSGISMPVVFIHEPEHNDIAEQAECLGANVCICSTANACAVVDALTAAVLQHSFARCRSFLSAFAA